MAEMRQNLLPILEAGGVDLVLAGHSHSYERSHLLDGAYGFSGDLRDEHFINRGDGRVDGDGPYLKPGGNAPRAGAVYVVAGSSGKLGGGPLNHPAMYLSLNKLGSLILDVEGPELHGTFLNHRAQVRDYFTLRKP